MGDSHVSVWPLATERLRADPDFGPVVTAIGPVRLRAPRADAFASLAASIVSQQLSARAARTIHDRFAAALGGTVTPARVLEASDALLRGAGLSAGKLAAIRDLADRAASGELALDRLGVLSNEEIVERLVVVRGIGAWTAHMFMIFQLHRADIWPTGDLGVRNGLARVLGLAAAPTPREMAWIGFGYRPWRSAAAWYCWRATELGAPPAS